MPPRVLLRLDDGSLVGYAAYLGAGPHVQGAVRLQPTEAAALVPSRVSELDVQRLNTLLARLKDQYGVTPPEQQQHQQQLPQAGPPKKRARDSLVSAPSGAGDDWRMKCSEMVRRTIMNLQPHAVSYVNRVDPNILKDYYVVVKNPIFIGDIRSRLTDQKNNAYYQEASQFYNDMKQHFENVRIYNPEGDAYRNLGDKVERLFDTMWASSGLGGDRGKRYTAGLAPNKFEPDAEEAKPRPSRSGQANKRPRSAAGLDQAVSLEALSGFDITSNRPSAERIAEIGAFLGTEDLPEEYTTMFLALLPKEITQGVESGELELDFDMLDDATVWRVDSWLRSLPMGAAAAAPGASPVPRSIQRDAYSDEDYNGDGSESSD
mmetsp:Transcript_9324/g.16500  ORF Transcript_9324/g.16500 Transcript_9324/m.16500 type:complete len:376 (+) Transcript_9324:142-1269(+)